MFQMVCIINLDKSIYHFTETVMDLDIRRFLKKDLLIISKR